LVCAFTLPPFFDIRAELTLSHKFAFFARKIFIRNSRSMPDDNTVGGDRLPDKKEEQDSPLTKVVGLAPLLIL
jgi:hypothetical protein